MTWLSFVKTWRRSPTRGIPFPGGIRDRSSAMSGGATSESVVPGSAMTLRPFHGRSWAKGTRFALLIALGACGEVAGNGSEGSGTGSSGVGTGSGSSGTEYHAETGQHPQAETGVPPDSGHVQEAGCGTRCTDATVPHDSGRPDHDGPKDAGAFVSDAPPVGTPACDGGAGCVLCSDDEWHCSGGAFPSCPANIVQGEACDAAVTPPFTISNCYDPGPDAGFWRCTGPAGSTANRHWVQN
jgi:hypothetical protein